MRLFFYIALIGLLSISMFSKEKVNVYGFINDIENRPIEGAIISLEGLNLKTVSDEKGFFKFENIVNADHYFHIESYNFKFFCKKLIIDKKDTTLYLVLNSKTNVLDEMVLEDRGMHIKQKRSVNSISFISKTDFKKNNYSTVSDILVEIPGIRKMNTGISISKPVIRGMSGDRVSVYDIGIKQEDQQWGNDHGLQISKYDLDKITIYRGSASLMFSGANGGAIDITPDTYIIGREKIVEGNIYLGYKTNNAFFDISNQTKINFKNSILDVRLNYQKYQDYRIPSNSFNYNDYIFPIKNNRLKNTAGEEKGISLIYKSTYHDGFFLLKVSNVNQKNGIFSGAVGIPTLANTKQDDNYSNIDFPYQNNNHFKAIFYVKNNFLGNWIENSLGFQNNLREELTIPSNHGRKVERTDNMGLKLVLNTLSNNLKYNISLNDNKNLYIGLYTQFQVNKRDGFEYLIPDYKDFLTEFYSTYREEIEEKFSYELGGKVGYKIISSQEFETVYEFSNMGDYILRVNGLKKNYFGYSFSGGASYFPNDKISYKFNASLVYKFPIIPELASNGIHHGTFRHEKGEENLNMERGITLESEVYFSGENIAFKITPFFSHYWNYIFLSPSLEFSPLPEGGQIYQYRQLPVNFFGVEFNKIVNIYKNNLSLNLKGDYIYSLNIYNKYSLPFTPPFYFKLILDYNFNVKNIRISSKISQDFSLAQNRVAINEKTTDGYTTTNIFIESDLNIKNKTILNFSLGITNIFNTKYFYHLSRYRILDIPEQGRNIVLGINYNF